MNFQCDFLEFYNYLDTCLKDHTLFQETNKVFVLGGCNSFRFIFTYSLNNIYFVCLRIYIYTFLSMHVHMVVIFFFSLSSSLGGICMKMY